MNDGAGLVPATASRAGAARQARSASHPQPGMFSSNTSPSMRAVLERRRGGTSPRRRRLRTPPPGAAYAAAGPAVADEAVLAAAIDRHRRCVDQSPAGPPASGPLARSSFGATEPTAGSSSARRQASRYPGATKVSACSSAIASASELAAARRSSPRCRERAAAAPSTRTPVATGELGGGVGARRCRPPAPRRSRRPSPQRANARAGAPRRCRGSETRSSGQ